MSKKVVGTIIAPVPIIGKITASGKSAYEVWLSAGNSGTVADYLNSLKGEGSDKHFVHKQTTSTNVWNITHPLDKLPSVTIVDSGGTVVNGKIEYISNSEIIISFINPFTGEAYLN